MENAIKKKREKLIEKMVKKANDLCVNYTWEKWSELFTICCDWNAEHEDDEEIFMCEICKSDGYEHNGIMIEDDVFYFEED